jgi:hypothetical protein
MSILQQIYYINVATNVLASIFTLYLLVKIKRKNTYNLIIFWMTIMQGIYDLFQFHYYDIANSEWHSVIIICSLPAGLVSALFTLSISYILWYIVISKNYIDLTYNKFRLLFTIFGSCFIFQIALVVTLFWTTGDEYQYVYGFYQYSRLLIIVIITVFACITYYILNQMKTSSTDNNRRPIYLLARKLCLYPIIQLISRVPYFISFNFSDNENLNTFADFCIPIGGIGNLIAFIIANPNCKEIISNAFFVILILNHLIL